MNHRGGWALIKNTWTSWMQYRSFFFVIAFSWMIPPLIFLFVWSTLAEQQPLHGVGRGEFVAYYLILILVNQLTFAQTNWTLGDNIRVGNLNFWLLRPLSPIYQVLATEVAGKVVFMTFVIPIAGLLALFLHPELTATVQQVLLFLAALALAWLLRFFWGCWLALLAFWSSRADALLAVQDACIFLFAGIVAPMFLLPPAMQDLARWLPFRYMVGFPIEILVQHLDQREILFGFAVQAGWLAVAMVLTSLTWHLGLRRYTAVGG